MQSERFVRYVTLMFRLLAFSPLTHTDSFYYKIWYYFYRIVSVSCGSTIIALTLIEIQLSVHASMRFSDYSKTVVVLAVYISLASKSYYFFVFQKNHLKLTNRVKQLFRTETHTGLKERQFTDYAKNADFLSAFWVISTMIGTQIFMLIPVILTGEWSLPLKVWYPFEDDVESLYVLTYGFQIFTHNLMVFNFIITDMFFITINVITSSQFRLIAWEYEYMCYAALASCGIPKEDVLTFKDNPEERLKTTATMHETMQSERYVDALNGKFTDVIEFHKDLAMFCVDFENFISPVMLSTTLASIFHTTVIAFTFVTATNLADLVSSVSYVVLTLIHIFTLNFVGQQIINHSSQLEHTLYNCPWYLCHKKFVKLFKFVHLRSQEYAFVTIGKFAPINLQTFMSIIKSCVSYLTILRSMDQKRV